MEQLIQDVTEYLDLDTRFWNTNDGEFEYGDDLVFFRKLDDVILLSVNGVMHEAPRL